MKNIAPKYVLEMTGLNYLQTPSCWKGRVPSVAKLEREVMAFVVSTYEGYANEHIGKYYGIQIPARAVVRENKGFGAKIIVEWKAPMFMVLPNAEDYPEVKKIR
jgi:hypothetical protein